MGLPDDQWERLLTAIKEENCTPFIGPEVYAEYLEKVLDGTGNFEYPLGKAFTDQYKLTKDKYGYPLEAFEDFYKLAKDKYGDYPSERSYYLARVAQILAIENQDELSPKEILSSELKRINPKPSDFSDENRNTPYAVLADLNLPMYVTTNYDHFMEAALKSRGKQPVSEFCRWNQTLYNFAKDAGYLSVFDKENRNEAKELKYRPTTRRYRPTKSEPLVYHLHGIIDVPQSMVLTEKDYFDFVIDLNRDDEKKLLPSTIRLALASKSLLFIGYRLEDITFRVIFQGVMSIFKDQQKIRPRNIAVQLPTSFPEERRDKVHAYLSTYIQNMFELYAIWGTLDDFSKELRKKLDEFRNGEEP
jgi:SIR2-like domain